MTRSFILTWVIAFLQYLVLYGPMTTIALYAIQAFAAADIAAGFAVSAFMIGATIARLAAGYLADVLGRRRVLIVALALATIASIAHLAADSLVLLIAARFVHGMTYAVASTAAMAIAQGGIPPERRAEGTGYLALGNGLAAAVGPGGSLLLYLYADPEWLFIALTAVTVLSLVCALRLERDAAWSQTNRRPFRISDALHPAVVPIAVFMLLIGLGYAGVMTYINAFAEERGLFVGAGVFFVAYAVVTLIIRMVLGRVQDRRGDNIVFAIGVISFAASLLTLAAATSDVMVIIAGALTGMGYGTLFPAVQAVAVRRVPADRIGTGVSTQLFMLDLGVGLSPLLLGPLVAWASYSGLYLVLAGLVTAAGGYYWLVHGRHQR